MALNSEEFRRRRQEREALRRKQQRKQKKVMRLLLLSAGLLLVLGVILFFIARNAESPAPSQPDEPSATGETQETQSGTTVIRFAAAGDLNVTDKVVKAGGEHLDYAPVFRDLIPVLASADLTTLNFEGNACGLPYGSQTLSAPTELLRALSNAGVDMLQMANSRSIHNGMPGLATTLQNIRAAGMEPVGAWETLEQFQQYEGYSIFEVQGVRVGVIAFTKGMDGMALPEGFGLCVNYMYSDYASTYQKVYTARLEWLMEQVEQENPDITIVLLHWGSEYNDGLSKTQKTIRDLLLDLGADAIIGTHPHYVQEVAWDQDAGTVVAYSLGDFLGDGDKEGTAYSVILELEITKDVLTGDTAVTDVSYTPIYTVQEEDGSMRILRIREAIASYENGDMGCVSKTVYNSMKAALERIEARVNPPQEGSK